MKFRLRDLAFLSGLVAPFATGCTGLEAPAVVAVYSSNLFDGLVNPGGEAWTQLVQCSDLANTISLGGASSGEKPSEKPPMIVVALPYRYDEAKNAAVGNAGLSKETKPDLSARKGIESVARAMPAFIRRDLLLNPRDQQAAANTVRYQVYAVQDATAECTPQMVENLLLGTGRKDGSKLRPSQSATILSGRFFHEQDNVYMQTSVRLLRIRPNGEPVLSNEVIATEVVNGGRTFAFTADLPIGQFDFPRRVVLKTALEKAEREFIETGTTKPKGVLARATYLGSRTLNTSHQGIVSVEGDEVIYRDKGPFYGYILTGILPWLFDENEWTWRTKVPSKDIREFLPELEFVDLVAEFHALADRLERSDSRHTAASYRNILRAADRYTEREHHRQKSDGTTNIELAFSLGLAQTMEAIAALNVVATPESSDYALSSLQRPAGPEFASDLEKVSTLLPQHSGLANLRGTLAMAMLSLPDTRRDASVTAADALDGFFNAIRFESNNPQHLKNTLDFYTYHSVGKSGLDISTKDRRKVLGPEEIRARIALVDAAISEVGHSPERQPTIPLRFPVALTDHPIRTDSVLVTCDCHAK